MKRCLMCGNDVAAARTFEFEPNDIEHGKLVRRTVLLHACYKCFPREISAAKAIELRNRLQDLYLTKRAANACFRA